MAIIREKHWKVAVGDHINAERPDEIIGHLLSRRGLDTDAERQRFLNPRLQDLADPLRLQDMDRAVERAQQALLKREKILIYSDYDVDGMSSSALLYRFWAGLNGEARVFIPERKSEGYGLSIQGLQRALSDGPVSLLFALDCGTTSCEEVAWLNSRGIDVIIIDHHELGSELPAAHAFINPQRGETDRILSTAGLVFKFCHAFLKIRRDPSLFNLKEHLDFVALGTVADLVPLRDDNRILVRHGLEQLNGTNHIGLQALMDVAGVQRDPTPSTVGFVLGPRLNASGRLAEARSGWELLTTEDPGRATDLARDLDQLNRERQKLEQTAFEDADALLALQPESENKYCIVVASPDWHQGVVGIVASRLQRSYYKPVIVISLSEKGGKGSARCIEGCSIMDALRDNAHFLKGFGGHAMAAGLEIEPDKIPDFRKALNAWFCKSVDCGVYLEQLRIDLELPGRALTENLAEETSRLEPFGKQNESPVYMVRGIRVLGAPKIFAQRHIRFTGQAAGVRFAAVGFGMAGNFASSAALDLAGHWEVDGFTQRPSFRILDWRRAA
ncbi:MAG: single-stranded-DNA-specific exonuclease RecJ [Methylacidiphilales bacterium]|nr:single-stranded-DNA-specific exonuclease RecJ [Candidatus Methylacidiphilales bacterium]